VFSSLAGKNIAAFSCLNFLWAVLSLFPFTFYLEFLLLAPPTSTPAKRSVLAFAGSREDDEGSFRLQGETKREKSDDEKQFYLRSGFAGTQVSSLPRGLKSGEPSHRYGAYTAWCSADSPFRSAKTPFMRENMHQRFAQGIKLDPKFERGHPYHQAPIGPMEFDGAHLDMKMPQPPDSRLGCSNERMAARVISETRGSQRQCRPGNGAHHVHSERNRADFFAQQRANIFFGAGSE